MCVCVCVCVLLHANYDVYSIDFSMHPLSFVMSINLRERERERRFSFYVENLQKKSSGVRMREIKEEVRLCTS